MKESPDKIFFGRSLHTNLPKPSMVHTEYKDRYINQDQNTQGNKPSTHSFVVNDTVWIKLNEDLPWKKGVIAKVHDHQSYMVQVDGRMYQQNTHHLMRRYPQVDEGENVESDREDDPIGDTPQRTLRPRHRVKMPRIPLQATVQQDFFI